MPQGKHAASGATVRKLRRTAVVVLAAGAMVTAGGTSASADVLSGDPLNGEQKTDQNGEQNLDCGNSAKLVRANVADTDRTRENCTDTDGHTRSQRAGDARSLGGTTLGPQANTAQAGHQNLHCGNSADVVTVNALGTIDEETDCTAVDSRGRGGGGSGDAVSRGGTAVGTQTDTAQTGKQNLHCGNSEGVATVNMLGTVRKRTDCAAADRAPGSGPATVRRGRASAEAGDVTGTEYSTAQNGRQNQACGRERDIVVPLGETERTSRCTVEDTSGRRAG